MSGGSGSPTPYPTLQVLTYGTLPPENRPYIGAKIVNASRSEAYISLQIVTDQGGVVTKAETMGKRALAYEINHHKDGTFVLLEIEGSGREIAELERRMRVNDRILRYITVRVDEDRRRAEKLKERRARKAAKRPAPAGAPVRRGPAMEFAEASGE